MHVSVCMCLCVRVYVSMVHLCLSVCSCEGAMVHVCRIEDSLLELSILSTCRSLGIFRS